MRRGTRLWLAVGGWMLCTSCAATFADPTGKHNSLEEAQRRYTQLVRWGELERASEFVQPELVDAFIDFAPNFEQIRVTDYEIGPIQYDTADAASVTVTYRAYSLTSFIEKPIREEQQWVREGGLKNIWRVETKLIALLDDLQPAGP